MVLNVNIEYCLCYEKYLIWCNSIFINIIYHIFCQLPFYSINVLNHDMREAETAHWKKDIGRYLLTVNVSSFHIKIKKCVFIFPKSCPYLPTYTERQMIGMGASFRQLQYIYFLPSYLSHPSHNER